MANFSFALIGPLIACCIPASPRNKPPTNAAGSRQDGVNSEIIASKPVQMLAMPSSLTITWLSEFLMWKMDSAVKPGLPT